MTDDSSETQKVLKICRVPDSTDEIKEGRAVRVRTASGRQAAVVDGYTSEGAGCTEPRARLPTTTLRSHAVRKLIHEPNDVIPQIEYLHRNLCVS